MERNIINIKIVDSGVDKYVLSPKPFVLGRQYENNSTEIQIDVPDAEKNNTCFLVVKNQYGTIIDHIKMVDNKCIITNNISQYPRVFLGFYFSGENDYLKGSEITYADFLSAPKPDDFVPVEPEQKKSIDYLIENAVTKFTNELVNYYLKSETYSQKEVDDLIKKELAQITATQIRNKAPNLVINATSETFQTIATQYIVDNYSRQPQEYDGLYLTMTDHENQVVEYVYHNNAWIPAGFDKVDLSNYMDLITEQRVSGRKIFEDETSFENQASFENGLIANDSVIITTDTEKDMVTKYSADEIVRETGSGEQAQTYNYKFPNKSGTLATEEDIAYLEYPPYIEITPSSATNGTLTEEVFDILNDHIDIKIKLNGEYYDRKDENNVKGLVSYIHNGWNGKANQTKSINITTSTRAWTLVVGKDNYYNHYIELEIDGKAFYYNFNSTQGTAFTSETLPVMPDNSQSVFVMIDGGHYSNVNGLIYRSSDKSLKAIMHGMYTSNGTSFNYLNLLGSAVTFKSDNVVEI